MGPATQRAKVPQRVIANQQHVPAAAAIAAVRAPAGHVRFTSEADAASATVPGMNVDACAIVQRAAG
jgi:hypothetical protein